jgi:hypothetical protein
MEPRTTMLLATQVSSSQLAAPAAGLISQGPWVAIPLDREVRSEARRVVRCEVRWPVSRITDLAPRVTLGELEAAWDRAQVRVEALLAAGVCDEEPVVVAASRRLRRALFRAPSRAPRSARKKGTFGRVQVCLAGQRPLSLDVQLVGLEDALAALDAASEALGARLGGDDLVRAAQAPVVRRPVLAAGVPFDVEGPTNDNAAAMLPCFTAPRMPTGVSRRD